MNIAVVDDFSADRDGITNFIYRFCRENSIAISLTSYVSGEEFLDEANIAILDAVFLDVYMLDIDGMEVAREIRQAGESCSIIFVTTTEAFAVQSYEVRAFDYLLKPINYEHVANVMSLLENNIDKSSRYIAVKEGKDLRKVFLSELIYVDYSNHYVQFHTESAIISTYAKFAEFESQLSIYPMFMACYRCIMVNMDKIEKTEEYFFLMKNGEYIPINRVNVKKIKARYINYIFGEIATDT